MSLIAKQLIFVIVTEIAALVIKRYGSTLSKKLLNGRF